MLRRFYWHPHTHRLQCSCHHTPRWSFNTGLPLVLRLHATAPLPWDSCLVPIRSDVIHPHANCTFVHRANVWREPDSKHSPVFLLSTELIKGPFRHQSVAFSNWTTASWEICLFCTCCDSKRCFHQLSRLLLGLLLLQPPLNVPLVGADDRLSRRASGSRTCSCIITWRTCSSVALTLQVPKDWFLQLLPRCSCHCFATTRPPLEMTLSKDWGCAVHHQDWGM